MFIILFFLDMFECVSARFDRAENSLHMLLFVRL